MLQVPSAPPAGPDLRDIHIPPPPSWWPPAPGWWLLAVMAIAICGLIGWFIHRRAKRARRRRAVLAEFERAIQAAGQDGPPLAAALSAFLRRLSMRDAPDVAASTGEAWLRHLDGKIASNEFTSGVGRALIEAPYRAQATFDSAGLIALVRRTVRKIVNEAPHV